MSEAETSKRASLKENDMETGTPGSELSETESSPSHSATPEDEGDAGEDNNGAGESSNSNGTEGMTAMEQRKARMERLRKKIVRKPLHLPVKL